MSELPLVVCGPIVRRVSAARVCIWVATSEPRDVELMVYREREGAVDEPVVTGRRATVRLGERLHVVAVSALASPGLLRAGETYFYSLRFDEGDRWVSFEDAGVLDERGGSAAGESILCYTGQRLPSFVLPPDRADQIRFAHGSCRRPHGLGSDALAILDDLLSDSIGRDRPEVRPQQLFLTGDQVYADDVHPEVLERIEATIPRLFGRDAERESELARHADELRPGERGRFMAERAHFSSDKAGCHLVSLAEYYTVYLVSWSDVLWRNVPPGDPALAAFRAKLPAVRRALANVATYMLFDDHDVTDDWNRSAEWVASVAASEHGRRVVRNALAAYGLFQHWGNDPAEFDKGRAGAELIDALDSWDGTAGEQASRVSRRIFVPAPGESLEPIPKDALRWGFTLDAPCNRVVALDCRTRRRFARGASGPGLMSIGAIDEALGSPRHDRPFMIVLSPTPVLGIKQVERTQKLAALLWRKFGLETDRVTAGERFDVEAWAFDTDVHEHLLERLAGERRVIVLSGDVHYGFAASATTPGSDAKILNFVSSALRNRVFPEPWERRVERALAALPGDRFLSDEGKGVVALDVPPAKIGRFEDVPLGPPSKPALAAESDAFLDDSVRPEMRRAEIVSDTNLGDIVLRGDEAIHTLHSLHSRAERGSKSTVHRGVFPLARALDT